MEIELKSNEERKRKDRNINIEDSLIITIDSCYLSDLKRDLEKKYKFSIIDNKDINFLGSTIREELDAYSGIYNKDVLIDLLNIFEYTESFLDKETKNLSHTEKIYVNLIRNLIQGNDRLLFINVTKYLDYNDKKLLIKIFNYLKSKNYYILITSEDVNSLYELGDYSLVWYKNYVVFDKTDVVYTNVEELLNNKINVPTLSLLTYKVEKEKKVNLFYRKDVRDTIKDIYKHV